MKHGSPSHSNASFRESWSNDPRDYHDHITDVVAIDNDEHFDCDAQFAATKSRDALSTAV